MISNSKLEKIYSLFYRSVSQSWRPFLQGNLVILSRSLCSVLEKETIHISIDMHIIILIQMNLNQVVRVVHKLRVNILQTLPNFNF